MYSANMNLAKHIKTGKEGELKACEYLAGRGFGIIRQSLKTNFGEIDVLCRDLKGELVFVEVKTLGERGSLRPEDSMTKAKLDKTKRMREFICNKYPELIKSNAWRIDFWH